MLSNFLSRIVARVVLVCYITNLFAPVIYACDGGVQTQHPIDHLADQQKMRQSVRGTKLPHPPALYMQAETSVNSKSSALKKSDSYCTILSQPSDKEQAKAKSLIETFSQSPALVTVTAFQAQTFQYLLDFKTLSAQEANYELSLSRKLKESKKSYDKLHTDTIRNGILQTETTNIKEADEDVLLTLLKGASIYKFTTELSTVYFSWNIPGIGVIQISKEGTVFVDQDTTTPFLSFYDLVLKTSGNLFIKNLNVAALTLNSKSKKQPSHNVKTPFKQTIVLGALSTYKLHTDNEIVNLGGLTIKVKIAGSGKLTNHGILKLEGTVENPTRIEIREFHNIKKESYLIDAQVESSHLHITADNWFFLNNRDAEFRNTGAVILDAPRVDSAPFINKGIMRLGQVKMNRQARNSGDWQAHNMTTGTSFNNQGTLNILDELTVNSVFKNVGDVFLKHLSGTGIFKNHNLLKFQGKNSHIGIQKLFNQSNLKSTHARAKGESLWFQNGNKYFINDTDSNVEVDSLRVLGEEPYVVLTASTPSQDKKPPSVLNRGIINSKTIIINRRLTENQGIIKLSQLDIQGAFNNAGTLETNLLKIQDGMFHNKKEGTLKAQEVTDIQLGTLHNDGQMHTGTYPHAAGRFAQNSGEIINTGLWNHKGDIDLGATKLSNTGNLQWQQGVWNYVPTTIENRGSWHLDQISCSHFIDIINHGYLHLKRGALNFNIFKNAGLVELSKGQYSINVYQNVGVAQKIGRLSFLEHNWTLTDAVRALPAYPSETKETKSSFMTNEKDEKKTTVSTSNESTIDISPLENLRQTVLMILKPVIERNLTLKKQLARLSLFPNIPNFYPEPEKLPKHSECFKDFHSNTMKNLEIYTLWTYKNLVQQNEALQALLRATLEERRPSHLIIKRFDGQAEIQSQKLLSYDLKRMPKSIDAKESIVFTERHISWRTLDDLKRVRTPDTVFFWCSKITQGIGYKFENIGHLNLYVKGALTLPYSLQAPLLTLTVEGSLTLGRKDVLATVAATTGPLTVTADDIDGRFGHFYGHGPTKIKATSGDIRCGAAVAKSHDMDKGIGWSSQYTDVVGTKNGYTSVSDVNGSSISSNSSLELEGNNLFLSFGTIYSNGLTTFKARKNKIEAIRAIIKGTGVAHWDAPQIYIGRLERALIQIGWMSVKYTDVYEWAAMSDQSEIHFNDSIWFKTNNLTNLASTISSGRKIFLRTAGGDIDLFKCPAHTSVHMLNQGWGQSSRSIHLAKLIAADAIEMRIGNFVFQATMNAANISIKALSGLFHNDSCGRDTVLDLKTRFFDFSQFAENEVKKITFLQPTSKETFKPTFGQSLTPYAPTVDQSLGIFVPANLYHVYSSHLRRSSMLNPFKGLPLGLCNLFVQQAFVEIAGRIPSSDIYGDNIAATLFDLGIVHRRNLQKPILTEDDFEHIPHAMLIPGLCHGTNQETLQLIIPPQECNPYRSAADISGDRFTCNTINDQTHLGNRIVTKKQLDVRSEKGALERRTESYTVTHSPSKGCTITEQKIKPQQHFECKEGDVNAMAHKAHSSIGTYTEAGGNILETSETDTFKAAPVIQAKTTETLHEEDDGLFSSTTVHEKATTHTILPTTRKAGRSLIVKAGKTIDQTATHDSAGKAIVYDAAKTLISGLILANKIQTTTQTSGMFSEQQEFKSQDTPFTADALVDAPDITLKGDEAKARGTVFVGERLTDVTNKGTYFGPVVKEMQFHQEVKNESPLAFSRVGTKGGEELMQPCRFMVNQIIRTLNDNPMNFDSVIWDRNHTQVIGTFTETTYQLKQWQTSWAIHEQLIPDEALVVVALGIAIATQGWGAEFAAETLGLGTTASAMFGAGLAGISTQVGTSYLRAGDPLAAATSLFTDHFARSLGTSIATAGIFPGGTGYIKSFT